MIRKVSYSLLTALLLSALPCHAEKFDSTLRIDCIFSGNDSTASISVSKLHSIKGWAGRSVNMDYALLEGNGRITLLDRSSGDTLFVNNFSTLFQEWQSTEEATRCTKAFENVFLVPMPKDKATVSIELFDSRKRVSASLSYPIDPSDILIKPFRGEPLPHEYIHYSGDPSGKIDIAIIGDGYTVAEKDLFMEDARKAVESIWTHEPFASMKDRFNIVAVQAESADSGVSVPRQGIWKNTVLGSHFDTFYSDRYLTTLNLFDLFCKFLDVFRRILSIFVIFCAIFVVFGLFFFRFGFFVSLLYFPGFLLDFRLMYLFSFCLLFLG